MAEVLTSAQMAAYLRNDDDFAEWYVEEFMKNFLPQYYFNVSDDGKRRMVTNGRHYAQGYGLTLNEAQAHFITLMWEIGANFDLQPGFHHFTDCWFIFNLTCRPLFRDWRDQVAPRLKDETIELAPLAGPEFI